MHRHLQVYHPLYVADPDNQVESGKRQCPHDGCEQTFTRTDNFSRHEDRCHPESKPAQERLRLRRMAVRPLGWTEPSTYGTS